MTNYRFRGEQAPTMAQRASKFEAAPAEGGSAEANVYLYDPIDSWGGDWGVSAVEFGASGRSGP